MEDVSDSISWMGLRNWHKADKNVITLWFNAQIAMQYKPG